jgi:predicted nucleic acid-binding protein
VLTEDRAAREQARRWGLLVSGTIGILLTAVQDGRIVLAEGNSLLRQMVLQAHFRSPTLDLGLLLP